MLDDVQIHPSAIVDEGATIGSGSRVWHFVHVCSGAKIGKGVSLGQNVFVGNKGSVKNRVLTTGRSHTECVPYFFNSEVCGISRHESMNNLGVVGITCVNSMQT